MTQQVRQKEEIMITIPSAAPQEYHLMPLDTISGFEVRPGLYEIYGATLLYTPAMLLTANCCFSAKKKKNLSPSFHSQKIITSEMCIP